MFRLHPPPPFSKPFLIVTSEISGKISQFNTDTNTLQPFECKSTRVLFICYYAIMSAQLDTIFCDDNS